jgi:glycosyltransferase involved in cell wall biosynthesis
MRIGHVNFAKGFRGGERQTEVLIRALAALGLEQVLIARKDSPLHARLADVPRLRHVNAGKPYIKALTALRHLPVDLLHAHEAKAAQWVLLNYWLRKTPYMVTRRLCRAKIPWFTRAVYRNAAAVIAISGAVRASIQRVMSGLEIGVIPDSYADLQADRGRLQQLRAKYRDRFVVGHVAALVDRHKGQSVLIQAAKLLAKKYPAMIFLLVGDGPDRQMLQALAAGSSNIEFIGFVEDVGTWIALFDLFAFPSFEEAMGSTLLDVMQHNKPIVASDVEGIPEIVRNGHSGLLVPSHDPAGLAAAIERMYLDPELRARCAAAAAQGLGRYSPPHIAECYYSAYKSVLAGDPPR